MLGDALHHHANGHGLSVVRRHCIARGCHPTRTHEGRARTGEVQSATKGDGCGVSRRTWLRRLRAVSPEIWLVYRVERDKFGVRNVSTSFADSGGAFLWGNGLTEAGHFALEALYDEDAVRRYWVGDTFNRYDPLAARAMIPRGSMKLRDVMTRHPLPKATP